MLENLIGHESNKRFFTKLLSDVSRINHSYMFLGKSGIGKKTFALEIANHLAGMNRNVHYIEPEKNNIPIDKIRTLKEEIAMPPFNGMGNKRVVVIDRADCMNEASQNAFLKILEEPPMYVVIFLILEDLNSMLGTIQSRCSTFQFLPIDDLDILEVIVEKSFDKAFTEFILLCIGGSYGKAKTLMENAELLQKYELLYSLIKRLLKTSKPNKIVYEAVSEVFTNRDEAVDYLQVFIDYCMKLYAKNKDSKYLSISKVIAESITKIKRGGGLNLVIITCVLDIIKINAKNKGE